MLHKIMETQKIANLLRNADKESLKFATIKSYVINDQNNADYDDGDENRTTIKFDTKVITSNLCDYSDAYILVTGDITAKVVMLIQRLHLKIMLHLQNA